MPLTGTSAPATGQVQVQGRGVGAGQQQSDPSIAPDILSYGRRLPPPSNLGGKSHPHRHPVTTSSRHHPAVATTWPTPWCRPSKGGRRHPGGCRDPWPLPTPPPPVHNGPAPAPCPGRPWSPAWASQSLPAAAPLVPPAQSPSSGPWRKSRGWDSGTPLVKMPYPEIFSKNHSG
jgi:hypothetical protein